MKSLAAFSIFLLLVVEINAQGCVFDITDLPEPQSIVLTAYTHKFLYPTGFENFDTRITIPRGELILISCPGGKLTNFNSTLVYAACNNLDQLIVNEKAINFTAIKCDSSDFGTLRTTNRTCGIDSNTKIVEIGLDINPGFIFVPLVTVCYDFTRRNPVYANFTMSGSLGIAPLHSAGNIREDFAFFNLSVPVSSLYEVNASRSTVNSLLGLNSSSLKYVKDAFHHEELVQSGEHFYESEARTVHRNLITWPQWRGCYVSDELHRAVSTYAASNRIELEIYTGTYGIASLPHVQTGTFTEIYLYNVGNVKAIPVPAMLWRLVYEPKSKRAVVLVGIDNINIVNVHDFVLCNDVANSIEWAYFSQFCGITYACSYQDFKVALPYIPQLDVTGLLT